MNIPEKLEILEKLEREKEIVLGKEICFDKETFDEIVKRGYKIEVQCISCCGMAAIEKFEDDGKICLRVVECYCHQGSYFIVITR